MVRQTEENYQELRKVIDRCYAQWKAPAFTG